MLLKHSGALWSNLQHRRAFWNTLKHSGALWCNWDVGAYKMSHDHRHFWCLMTSRSCWVRKELHFLCKKFMLWRQDQAWLARLVEPSLVSLMIILISVALVLKESRRLSRGCRGCLDPPPPQRYGPLLQYIESSPPLSSCWFSCLIFPSLKLLKQKRSPLRCSKIARKCYFQAQPWDCRLDADLYYYRLL